VVRTVTTEGWSEERARAIAAAVEGDSEHPVARGIREKATERNVELARVRDFEVIKGSTRTTMVKWYMWRSRLIEMLDLVFLTHSRKLNMKLINRVIVNSLSSSRSLPPHPPRWSGEQSRSRSTHAIGTRRSC
jgi:hypothetical protein